MGSAGDFDVQLVSLPEETFVARVTGELDMATAPRLEEDIASLGPVTRLVIDLSHCTFLDSAAVRLLTTIARDARRRGGSVAVVATDSGVLRVLEITAVDTMLAIHPTVDDAL